MTRGALDSHHHHHHPYKITVSFCQCVWGSLHSLASPLGLYFIKESTNDPVPCSSLLISPFYQHCCSSSREPTGMYTHTPTHFQSRHTFVCFACIIPNFTTKMCFGLSDQAQLTHAHTHTNTCNSFYNTYLHYRKPIYQHL